MDHLVYNESLRAAHSYGLGAHCRSACSSILPPHRVNMKMYPGSQGYNGGNCFMNLRAPEMVAEVFRKLQGRAWVTHAGPQTCKVSYARAQAGTADTIQ